MFKKTVIELLHPEIASASRSKPEKADALFEPALPVPTELCGVQEMAGRVYGTCPPPPDYKHLVNANMERTSELSVSGSDDANIEEHRGMLLIHVQNSILN